MGSLFSRGDAAVSIDLGGRRGTTIVVCSRRDEERGEHEFDRDAHGYFPERRRGDVSGAH